MLNVLVPPASFDNSGAAGFVRMLNEENRPTVPVKVGDLVIGAPAVLTGDPRINTRTQITATPQAPFTGSKYVEYHRNDLTAAFQAMWGTEIGPSLNMRDFIDLHEALPTFNWLYGLDLSPNDVPNHTFDHAAGGYMHDLVVASGSLLYIGTLSVQLYDMDWETARIANGVFRVTSNGTLRVVA